MRSKEVKLEVVFYFNVFCSLDWRPNYYRFNLTTNLWKLELHVECVSEWSGRLLKE